MSSSAFAPVTYPDVGSVRQAGKPAAQARGYAAGYSEGLRRAAAEHVAVELARSNEHRAALADAEAATRRAISALDTAAAQVGTLALPLIEDAEGTLIRAAFDLAEAVLLREVTGGRVTAADALRRAMAAAPTEELIAVRLNPADAKAAAEASEGTASVDLIADDSIASGDAIAVLRHGWLDARIDAALARAKSVLAEGHP